MSLSYVITKARRRAELLPERSRAAAVNLVFPPSETPAGAPELGFLIAYEDPEAEEGWSAGVVKAIEEGWEGREFTVDAGTGKVRVSRSAVFYWWAPGGLLDTGRPDSA
jgi:hypothetical protein